LLGTINAESVRFNSDAGDGSGVSSEHERTFETQNRDEPATVVSDSGSHAPEFARDGETHSRNEERFEPTNKENYELAHSQNEDTYEPAHSRNEGNCESSHSRKEDDYEQVQPRNEEKYEPTHSRNENNYESVHEGNEDTFDTNNSRNAVSFESGSDRNENHSPVRNNDDCESYSGERFEENKPLGPTDIAQLVSNGPISDDYSGNVTNNLSEEHNISNSQENSTDQVENVI